MNQTDEQLAPIIQSILHPTDFSEGSRVAFYHALKAAVIAQSELCLLHVSQNGNTAWSEFPGIRETLEHWELLPKGSPRSAVGDVLGIAASKIVAQESDPVQAVLKYLWKHPADLIVLATHQHKGRAAWLKKSVAEPVARRAAQMTLFIPGECRGFVSGQDGSVSLQNVLIPVAASPHAHPAVMAAAYLVKRLNCPQGNFTTLHVGEADNAPAFGCPIVDGWQWSGKVRGGDVIQTILDTAREMKADLIVMSTDGRNGFLDGLRGSHSERVLRQCTVPLLTVPAGSFAASYLS